VRQVPWRHDWLEQDMADRSVIVADGIDGFECIGHQENRDLEILINFLPISKKQEISSNHGNSQEISCNNHKFLRKLRNCSFVFLIFQYTIFICLISLCYLQLCMATLNAVLYVKEQQHASEQFQVVSGNLSKSIETLISLWWMASFLPWWMISSPCY